ncbi:G protein-coupled glucose receptor regulating Gpa2-domain-containing protein [Cladorrhinum samala]|uniref:G protein-coupled glucose receptor regulating Gpa2-domain-containing protein n=1 Tax=Cladorrhinum samala TaxID=585594 RepID=A0AAV9HSX1_9PEZI|nr:G protein-coupled glucose receptor regulating Gpa2-domain-containing protein [Cladorrhinum samala]
MLAALSVPFHGMLQHHAPPTAILLHVLAPIQARNEDRDDESTHMIYILSILSLVFASLSVVSTLSTLYWFVKMRRNFRHELILMLVQSDLIKSAAFVVFPIVSLLWGKVESDSAFCQISGFILTIGIESSDIAILLIALHSVMYIFRPQSGLFPYKNIAKPVFYLLPILTASLAFINGRGYENVGHYCYLRTDNSWSRLALSWVPRYFICAGIVGIYVFIYFYIRKRIDDYGRRSSGCLEPPLAGSISSEPSSPLAVPRIAYHGLVPSTPSSQISAADTLPRIKSRQASASSISTIRLERAGKALELSTPSGACSPQKPRVSEQCRRSIQWSWEGFDQAASSKTSRNIPVEESEDPLSTRGSLPALTAILPPTPLLFLPRRKSYTTLTSDPSDACSSGPTSSSLYYNRPLASNCPTHPNSFDATRTPRSRQQPQASPTKRSFSLPNIFGILRGGPSPRTSTSLPQDTSPVSNEVSGAPLRFSPSTFQDTSNSIAKNRDKMRRQLRNLFVYPLVYMIIWTFPFISHVMGYDDSVSKHDPQWLLILGILSLSVQGMVDCLLFTIREQPWRHAMGRGFWESLRKRWRRSVWGAGWFLGLNGACPKKKGYGMGRTREEMLVHGRLARERRAEEVILERGRAVLRSLPRVEAQGQGGARKGTMTREWWDAGVYAVDFEDDEDEMWEDDFEVDDAETGLERMEEGRRSMDV